MIPWLIAILAIGVILLIAGVCGRRIDDHPICRRCKFDLFGAPADRAQCPECGAHLAKPRATRIGQRKRSHSLIAIASLCILFALAPLAAIVYASVAGKDLSPYKPTWWLIADVRDAPPLETVDQFAELTTRLLDGDLADSHVDQIANHILTIQADLNQIWLAEWGDFIAKAHRRRQLAGDDWFLFLEQVPVLSITVRDRIRVGDPLTVRVNEQFREGTATPLSYLNVFYEGMTIGGIEFPADGAYTTSLIRSGPGGFCTFTRPSVAGVAPGTYEMIVRFDLSIAGTSGRNAPQLHTWSREFNHRIEVVPSDESVLELVAESDLLDEMKAAIGVIEWVHIRDSTFVSGRIRVNGAPRDVAFEVFLRSNGREWPLGSFASQQKEVDTHFIAGPVENICSPVEVILRASESAAMEIVDLESIWLGEIVIENVPLSSGGHR